MKCKGTNNKCKNKEGKYLEEKRTPKREFLNKELSDNHILCHMNRPIEPERLVEQLRQLHQ